MKPPPFAYAAPDSIDSALELLVRPDTEARLLAGGQSLVPLLNMRFARPSLLIDLNRVEELQVVEWENGRLRLGAMVRQHLLETDTLIGQRIPILKEAAGQIAHLAIRMRGTVGGSIAHADPAAELPAALLVLDAQMVLRSADRRVRAVPAPEFFLGPFTTAIEAGEMLTSIEVTRPASGSGWAFLELARVHGAFALVGAAAQVDLDPERRISSARLALCGVGATPYLPAWLDDFARGQEAGKPLFQEVAERVRGDLNPSGDSHGGAEYRRNLAAALTRRALAAALERAVPEGEERP